MTTISWPTDVIIMVVTKTR